MSSSNLRRNQQRMTTLSPGEPSQGERASEPVHVPMFDIEGNNDDAIETIENARRTTHMRTQDDLNMENQNMTTYDRDRMIPISGIYIDFEGYNMAVENVTKSPRTDKEASKPKIQEVEPPKETVLKCPICVAPFVEEMATLCGHIFCKKCIEAAITEHGKCPICMENVIQEDILRVFLPY